MSSFVRGHVHLPRSTSIPSLLPVPAESLHRVQPPPVQYPFFELWWPGHSPNILRGSIHNEGPETQGAWDVLAGTNGPSQLVQPLGSLSFLWRSHRCDIRGRFFRASLQIRSLPKFRARITRRSVVGRVSLSRRRRRTYGAQEMGSGPLSVKSKLLISLADVFTSGFAVSSNSEHIGAAQGGSLPLFKPEILSPNHCPSTRDCQFHCQHSNSLSRLHIGKE